MNNRAIEHEQTRPAKKLLLLIDSLNTRQIVKNSTCNSDLHFDSVSAGDCISIVIDDDHEEK